MNSVSRVACIGNWIGGREVPPVQDEWHDKYDPHSGRLLCKIADSTDEDVSSAIDAACTSMGGWSALTPVKRGQILDAMAQQMVLHAKELADCVALETGKPPQDARGEVDAAILQARFFAGEGMRLHGRSLTSAMQGKYTHSVRQPRGVCALIVPANTPIANIAWKVFPALICGNSAVLKASEDAPRLAMLFAQLFQAAGLPDGVLNVIQGRGRPAGAALVEDGRIAVVSFTGSTEVGRWIAEVAGRRLARVSLELGGKNPFVVCDDADLDEAVLWAGKSAFSNAGQRCAAASRVLVWESVYEEFRAKFVALADKLQLGVSEGCDLGPVINKRQHNAILAAIATARAEGGKILCGGEVPADPNLADGYYIRPTIIEALPKNAEIFCKELFGPVVTLQVVSSMEEALRIANATEYGLTSAIHTRSVDRAMWFAHRVRAGVANVNLGTFGSEPHMPFGGYGASGNGTREPGVEALDVYSELKTISLYTRAQHL
jgi:acyl-CoA reductase-like NAD-dependent aldehyde dehydrogenase